MPKPQFIIHFEIESPATRDKLDEYIHSLDPDCTMLNDTSRYFQAEAQVPDIFQHLISIFTLSDSFYIHRVILSSLGIGLGAKELHDRQLSIAKPVPTE